MNQLYKLVRYAHLSVTLYWLNNRTNLSLSVSLNRSTKDGQQRFCYTERINRNETNAYVDLTWIMKLRDIYADPPGSADFSITSRNLYQFVQTVHTLKIWFTDSKHKDLFMIDKAYENLYTLMPQAKGKKVILYAPTFRGRVAKATTPRVLIPEFMKYELGDEYVLLFKHHPLVRKRPKISEFCADFAMDVTDTMTIEDLLCVADVWWQAM